MNLIQSYKTPLSPESDKTRIIFNEGTADNTRKAYRKDLNYFFAWSELVLGGKTPHLPIETDLIIKFITDHIIGLDPDVDQALVAMEVKAKLGTHAISTVTRRISALSMFHKMKGLDPNPCVRPQVAQLLSKARRRAVKQGYKPKKKMAATLDRLNAMLATCDDSLSGTRTRALLLFAFSSGGRRASEVADADIDNLSAVNGDYTYLLDHSKTDQGGCGMTVPICGQAAVALRCWLSVSGIKSGRIFRGVTRHGNLTEGLTPTSISRIVKKHAALAGLNPEEFSAHSMRSGFVTEGGKQSHAIGDVMALSGHKTVTVAVGYYQAGAVLNNPASHLAG